MRYCPILILIDYNSSAVSKHSRLKAAGAVRCRETDGYLVSTHSRLKAAGFNAP